MSDIIIIPQIKESEQDDYFLELDCKNTEESIVQIPPIKELPELSECENQDDNSIIVIPQIKGCRRHNVTLNVKDLKNLVEAAKQDIGGQLTAFATKQEVLNLSDRLPDDIASRQYVLSREQAITSLVDQKDEAIKSFVLELNYATLTEVDEKISGISAVLSVDTLPKYSEYITVDGKTYLSSNHIIKCHNEYYLANENCAGLDLKLDGISGSLHDHLHNIEPYFCFNDENEQCLKIDGTVLLDSGVLIFGKVTINPKSLLNEDRKFYWNGVSIKFSPIKLNSSFVIIVATKDFKEGETNAIPENLQAHIKKYECYYTFSEEDCELQLSIFLNGVLINTCMSNNIDELYIPLDKAEYMSIESIDGIIINNIVFNDLYYFTDTYIDGTNREYQVRKRSDWSPLYTNINDYDIELAFCLPILEESILSLFETPEYMPNYYGTNLFIKSIPKNEIKTLF